MIDKRLRREEEQEEEGGEGEGEGSEEEEEPLLWNFYSEAPEISRMTSDEVSEYKKCINLDTFDPCGVGIPNPVRTWYQTGFTRPTLHIIEKMGIVLPTPIQTQTIPVIMSGRDCMVVSVTGSGKTLSYILPLMTHIFHQVRLVSEDGDGPIGLIIAPTRELVIQIFLEIQRFTKIKKLTCIQLFGGSSNLTEWINRLRRGTNILVSTPGILIDILSGKYGAITNLSKVSYVVIDEADRMMDACFLPQVKEIVRQTREDRQTVLFSATSPAELLKHTSEFVKKPVIIIVEGDMANRNITQSVEIMDESAKFKRLMELLEEQSKKKGWKVLVFVNLSNKCEDLCVEVHRTFACVSFHARMDQDDREAGLALFKDGACNVMIATSLASRGLDIKELALVVNYDTPNHYEDYVNRVGRTGRAGQKGCAITFTTKAEDKYSPELVRALEKSGQPVPEDLKALAASYLERLNMGIGQTLETGYGGSGFMKEDGVRSAPRRAQAGKRLRGSKEAMSSKSKRVKGRRR